MLPWLASLLVQLLDQQMVLQLDPSLDHQMVLLLGFWLDLW
jgi:hypothetical protein